MRRFFVVTVVGCTILAVLVPAWAGSPHFIYANATRSGNSLTVSFKEAGLGDEPTVNITVSATAECINGGSKHPKAVNKGTFSTSKAFTVNNGQATGTLTLTATFQPACSPPMTVVFTNVSITDSSNGISKNITGTF